MNFYRLFFSLILYLAAQPTSAIEIEYSLVPLGGTSYLYEYTVTNDDSLGAGVPIEWFDILFDTSLYDESSLTIVTPNPPATDWDEVLLGSGVGIPAAYDAFALSGGISNSDSVAGFSVQFDWIGSGMPGAQEFEVYDPSTFDLLEFGVTQSAGATIPEPNTMALLLQSAFIAFWVVLKRRRI